MKRMMRAMLLVGVSGGAWLAPTPLSAARAEVRCCLPVFLPGIPVESTCTAVVLRARRRPIAPRRLCRLAGGRVLRAGGGCSCR